MQQAISKTRIFIVLAVALIAIVATVPTARYYWFLSQGEVKPTSPKPLVKGVEPSKDDKILHAQWETQNPELIKWLKDNAPRVAWEQKDEQLRKSAIPLGLDLIGGVDVTLVVDKNQYLINETSNLMNSLKGEMERGKISADLNPDGKVFTIKVLKADDARNAYNILKNYESRLASLPSEEALKSGKPVTLELNPTSLTKNMKESIEGARKGISDRVDQLGVTQPRISIQGEDQIRVQVPGEKDPDRLINTVIQPANLEFRLVDDRSGQVVGADGKVLPGATIPVGTEVVPMKQGKINEQTGKMEYSTNHILVSKKKELTGKNLRSAGVTYNPGSIQDPIEVNLEFDSEGRRQFADVTEKNVGHRLAIMLDGVVRSAPNLKEPIRDGRAMITGGFTNEEATELSQILKAGSLKAPLTIESKRTVGASLGIDSIKSGINALILGSIVITILMVTYYGTAGVISIIALILNIMIVLAIMALSHATLTLSGIGGIMLTIGMAVDTNILIYERIREELAAGRPLRQAITLGVHRAFTVILDAHITTLFSALVLLQFTEGSVFGFALTMTFGLISNLFTGLTVTYTLCALWFTWRGNLSLGKLAIFKHTAFDFVKARFFSWGLSNTILIVAAVAVFAIHHGPKFGVDFAGGLRTEVRFNRPVTDDQVRKALLAGGMEEPNVQPVLDAPNLFIVDVRLAEAAEGKAVGGSEVDRTEVKVEAALTKAFPGAYKIEMKTGFGAQTSQKFKWLAITVTFLASGAILLYLWFRFELVFGVAAVVALLHDMLIVFFLSSLWGVQINLDVVAAFMVLMGFSVNDTIVVFDRIRENTRIYHGKSFGDICNLAMNQTLARTILTSGTVFLAVLSLYLIGGEGLRPFAKVYLLGTIFGTYSSDFIAAPIVYQWNKFKGNRLMQTLEAKKNKREAAKPIRSAGAATRQS